MFVTPGSRAQRRTPPDAQYVTLATDPRLTNERVLTPGSGLTDADGGAGSTYTLAVGAGNGITVNADDVAVDETYAFVWTNTHGWVRAGYLVDMRNTTDTASALVAIFEGDRATPTDGDEAYFTFRLSADNGVQTEVARLTWVATDVNAATNVDGRLDFAVMTAGTLANELSLDGTAVFPSSNGGLDLGKSSTGAFANAYLASGAVVNFNAGDVTITHAANLLAFAGASSGYTFDSAIVVSSVSSEVAGGADKISAYSKDHEGTAGDARFHIQGESGNPIAIGNNVVSVPAPVATTGASQPGRSFTVQASAAVASTDTNGAAAGGDLLGYGGDAARRVSSLALGGNIIFQSGKGIGGGASGGIVLRGNTASLRVSNADHSAYTEAVLAEWNGGTERVTINTNDFQTFFWNGYQVPGVLLASASPTSSDATVDFTLTAWTNSQFHAYLIVIEHIAPGTDNVELDLRTSTDGGANYDSGAGNYEYTHHRFNTAAASTFGGSAGDTKIMLAIGQGNAANELVSGHVLIFKPNTAEYFAADWRLVTMSTTTVLNTMHGSGHRLSAADVDAVRLLWSSGNFATAGSIKLYGLVL